MPDSQKLRFSILDPLRLAAALAVVLYHYSIYLEEASPYWAGIFKYGYLGVDFFFILSGFVIMASAQNRTAWEFAFARAIRIYPAFIICLVFTLLVSYGLDNAPISWKDIFWNATILNDYVGVANIDGVYWTLQAELKFYGCVFLLIICGAFRYWRYWLALWLFMAMVYYFYQQPFFMGWFINPDYSFYFIGGVCTYLLHKYPKDVYVHLLLAVSLIFAFLTAYHQASDFMAEVDSASRLIVAMVVAGFYLFFFLLAKGYFNIQKSSLLVVLGALSYPLYLIHNRAGKTIIVNYLDQFSPYFLIGVVTCVLLMVSFLIYKAERVIQRALLSLVSRSVG